MEEWLAAYLSQAQAAAQAAPDAAAAAPSMEQLALLVQQAGQLAGQQGNGDVSQLSASSGDLSQLSARSADMSQLAIRSEGMPQLSVDGNEQVFQGRVRKFTRLPGGDGGFGFIECEMAKQMFGRDVFLHANQMVGLKVGDTINFTVMANTKGEPQARNVMKHQDESSSQRHEGFLKNFNTAKGYGFIICPDVRAQYGCDVFLHRNEYLRYGGFNPGDGISFTVTVNASGKPQANDVIPTGQTAPVPDPSQTTDRFAGTENPYRGRIKSYSPPDGYGFIESPEAFADYGCDVFMNRKEFEKSGLSTADKYKGHPVSFTVECNRQGKPQAWNVQKIDQHPDDTNAELSNMMAMLQSELSPDDPMMQQLTEMMSQVTDAQTKPTIRLNPTGAPSKKPLVLQVGGNSQKTPLKLVPKLVPLSHAAGMQEAPPTSTLRLVKRTAADMSGPSYEGVIKSFSAASKYGFVESEVAYNKYGCDVFINSVEMERGLSVGDVVTFQIRENKNGKPQAFNCQSTGQKKPKLSPEETRSPQEGAVYYEGVIKSFSEKNGYGFIVSEQITSELGCDVFFSGATYEETIAGVGDKVTFRIEFNKDGKPHAYDINLKESEDVEEAATGNDWGNDGNNWGKDGGKDGGKGSSDWSNTWPALAGNEWSSEW